VAKRAETKYRLFQNWRHGIEINHPRTRNYLPPVQCAELLASHSIPSEDIAPNRLSQFLVQEPTVAHLETKFAPFTEHRTRYFVHKHPALDPIGGSSQPNYGNIFCNDTCVTGRLTRWSIHMEREVQWEAKNLMQLLCSWILSTVLFLFKTHNVSDLASVSVFR
jgi:hypothetical protein